MQIQTPSDPAAPLKLLAAGKVDLAISYEPELLLARDKGLQLVAVGALVQQPLTSIISIGKHAIADPKDLKGKTVGTAGIPYQSAYLKAILDRAGVDPSSVKEVNVGFNLVPAMKTKKVDATLGAFWNYEGVQLRLREAAPEDHPDGERRRPDLSGARDRRPPPGPGARAASGCGASCARSRQGQAALRSDPAAGVQPLLKANPDLDRKLQLESVKATLPAFFPAAGKPFGWMDSAQWATYGDWMYSNKLLGRPPNAARALTDEFLPGQGLADAGSG